METTLKEDKVLNLKVIKDFEEFKAISDIIVFNHLCEQLTEIEERIYMSDLYNREKNRIIGGFYEESRSNYIS